MKDRKTLQKVFGIMCALMALALGTVTVLVILPYLGGDLVRGLFDRMTAGLATIADTTKIPELLILLVAFIAPTILLAISAGKLLGGKSGRTVFEGSIVALVTPFDESGRVNYFQQTFVCSLAMVVSYNSWPWHSFVWCNFCIDVVGCKA